MLTIPRLSILRAFITACVLAVPSARAVDRVKANNTDALNLTTSWVGSVVPTNVDVAVWDATVTTANSVSTGGGLTIGGIRITSPGGNVTIGNTSTNTFTLGTTSTATSNIIDLSAATVDLTFNNGSQFLRFGGLSGSTQTINVAANRTVTINNKVSALGNNKTLALAGAGNVVFNSAIAMQTTGFFVNGANVSLNAANTFTLGSGAFTIGSGALNVGNNNALDGVSTIFFNGGNFNATGAARTVTQAFTLGGDVNYGGAFNLSLSGTLTGATRRVSYNGGQTFTPTGAGSSVAGLSLFNGTTVIDTGGSVTTAAGSYNQVGPSAGTTATMTVKGSGAFTSNGDLNVGDSGDAVTAANGTLNLQDSATVTIGTAGGLYIGSAFGGAGTLANGTVNQTGGTLTHNNTAAGSFIIGGRLGTAATGSYNLSAGSAASSGQVYVGSAGTGTLSLSGTGTFTSATNGVQLGNGASAVGTVNLNAGGTLSVSAVSKGAGAGTFNFNGGTLQARTNNATLLGGVTARVRAGGAIVDTNNLSVTIAQPLLEDAASTGGGLTKQGAGTLIFSATGHTYTGATAVTGGTLQVSSGGNTQSNLIGAGALNLSGGGRFRFNSTSASTFNNALDVGTGGGTISVRGGTTFSPTALSGAGTLTLDIVNGVTLTPTTFNGWNGAVNVSTTGAGATFRLASNFDNASLGNAALTLGAGITLTRNAGTNGTFTTDLGSLAGAAGSFVGGSGAGNGTFTFSVGARDESTTFAGSIVDGGTKTAFTKVGSGTQTLTGANTFTGATTVSGGALELGAGGTLANTASVNVTAGTLLLSGASEAINNSAALSLGAGTKLAFESGLSGCAETLDSLTLLGNAILDFGDGDTNRFAFTNGIAGLGSFTLSIYNWSGPAGAGTQDVLALSNALTATELSHISFYANAGGNFLGTGQEIAFGSPAFEVVPVPEPASTAAIGALALCGLVAWRERRRFF